MAFTVLRVSAVLLVAVLALPGVTDAAQRLNTADAHDFQMVPPPYHGATERTGMKRVSIFFRMNGDRD
ncbi:MAG TPA: hypothetical protein VKA59_01970 [Vicinamibacterales bacterium]|nr:hypothetical protein [Vicinamibacterales bacterium]